MVCQCVCVKRSGSEEVCERGCVGGSAPQEMYQRSIRFLSALNSPASQITTDDIAMFNNMQTAMDQSDSEWIYMSRGIGHDHDHDDGGQVGDVGTSELPLRAQDAAWRDFMSQ